MPFDPVDELLNRLVKGGKWPPLAEADTWRRLEAWRAFVDADREALKKVADWTETDREYKVDPLPSRIADAWADHLFGEELAVAHPDETDNERLDAIIDENDLTEEARGAERDLIIPEGEGWWRLYRDTDVAEVPLLEWHSRRSVAPFYLGRRLMAVALISVLEGRGFDKNPKAVFRHFEIHTVGAVEHVLFKGTQRVIGQTVGLDSHPETEELAAALGDGRLNGAVWPHGLPMLMGRITNRRGRSPRLGISEFAGIKDYLLDLNEAVTIGAENARLTAKKRMTAPANSSALRPRVGPLVDNGEGQLVPAGGGAQFSAGEDVFIVDPADAELGREGSPFQVLEYSYDATALIAHKRDLVESALTRIGLTPQWVGVRGDAGDGFAATGTALRLRLIPTDKAGRGKARGWDRELPRILSIAAQLDALPEAEGGLGQAWNKADVEPSVERADPIPADEVEQATIEATLVGAGVRSKWQSVKAQHPDWDDLQVQEELDRIKDDKPAPPAVGLFAPPPPGTAGEEEEPPA